jgi:hypothetical protein
MQYITKLNKKFSEGDVKKGYYVVRKKDVRI